MIGVFLRVSKQLLPALLIVASGCTTAPSPSRHLHHSAAEAAYVPPDLHLTLSDGLSVPVRLYRPRHSLRPRVVILALHGFGDSRDAWETLAPALTAQNVLIVAPDSRGFGETTSPSARWPGTERLVQDAAEERAWLHQQWPDTPLYVMGESMGGAVALLLNTREADFRSNGTILLAPAVMNLLQPLRGLLATWNLFAPHHVLSDADIPGPERVATTNGAALRRFFFDPLTRHTTTVNTLHGLVNLMAQAQQDAHWAHTPLLVIFGDHDDYVPPRAYAELFRLLPQGTRFDERDGSYHMLSRERYSIAPDILSWMFTPEKLLPSGGDIAASAWYTAR